MIKVLFESSIFLHQKVGGISKYVTVLNKNLHKYKISSEIFSPITINYFLDNKKKNNIYYLKLNKIPLFCRKIFFFLNNLLTLIKIKIEKPDIIHFSYYNNFLVKFLHIPYIITIYDLIHEKTKSYQVEFKKKTLLQNARHIICISNQTKKDLIRVYRINKKKISVIYLGVDNRNYKFSKKRKKFILFVGSRNKYKNFQSLIKAFSASKYLNKNYKIICFGGGNFTNEEIMSFEKLSVSNKIKYYKGNDFELENLYKKASLYVSLSFYEGFGLTLLEAMKFKCPVVCSDIPVFREIYQNSCKYVNPRNILSIKKGIENTLKSNEKKRLLTLNSKKIVSKFSWEKCTFHTSDVYKKFLIDEK